MIAMAVNNPYSRDNLDREKEERREREKARLERERQQRTLELLMNAQAQQSKKKMEKPKDVTKSQRGKKAAESRNEKRLAKKRKYQREEEDNVGTTGKGVRGSFQPTTLDVYERLSKFLKKSVGFEENGAHKSFGKWPEQFSGRTVDPQEEFCIPR